LAKKKTPQTREDVLEQAIEDIRGKFGEGSIMRLGESFRSAVEVIPTGILPLDVALGIGGLPKGRIVEIFGPEGSGKRQLLFMLSLKLKRPEESRPSLMPSMLLIPALPPPWE
jgi:recombination protein RecA